MSPLALALAALAGLGAAFALLYVLARRMDNYGLVDIAWAYGFGLMTAGYAFAAPGWPVRRALVGTMVGLWSLRLGTHLAVRVLGHHPEEDGRYRQLRQDWAGNFAGKMFGFYLLQAASVVVLGVGFLLSDVNPAPALHACEIAGAVLWLLAVSGEALADFQLAAFKRRPENRGRVCDAGLWRYSRHPNYFFEWTQWFAYLALAVGSPRFALACAGPVVMFVFLRWVSGIPFTEQQALRTRGDDYRDYQRTTPMLFPWFPRASPSPAHSEGAER